MFSLAHDLNLASTIYIRDGLKEVSKSTLEGLPDHNQKYLEWLQYMEERYQKGDISHQTPEWDTFMNDPVRKEKFLQEKCFQESCSPEFKLIARIGTAIPAILRQEADALQLMFGDDLLDHYYAELEGNVIIQDTLRAYLSTLSHKYVNLRVIEIGSGTGGTTLPVIEALSPVGKDGLMTKNSRISQFTYTDISAGFFDKAKSKFKAWKNIMEFRRLDIEKDPIDQGFEAGTYDIVLAANVLHATQDLTNTLKNARKLLRPGGKLLLHEGIGLELLSVPLAFGTLPGWWLSVEPYRRWGPLVDEKHWNQALKAADFTGTDLVLPDYQPDLIHSQSLMVANAVDPAAPAECKYPDTIIITTGAQTSSPLVSSVVKGLEKFELPNLKVVHWRDLAGLDAREIVFVSLLELDQSVFLDIAESDFNIIRKLLLTCQGGLWVTKSTTSHPEASIATGLIRTVRWERDLDTCDLVLLGLDDSDLSSNDLTAKQIAKLFDHHFITTTTDRNEEYNSDNGVLSVNRLIQADYINDWLASKVAKPSPQMQPFGADPTRALKLSTDAPGLLNRLMFIDDPVYPKPLEPEDVEVEIKATGLNFRDIMSAMGEVNGDVLGAEGAGYISRVGSNVTKVKKGDRVMIMADQTGCFNTYARSDQRCVSQIPDDMSFEIAASIPVIYCTVLYCLNDIGRLLKGETILIHAAAGGVGQAAIMVAQDRGKFPLSFL
jgi:SAM-dependent methyltransferase